MSGISMGKEHMIPSLCLLQLMICAMYCKGIMLHVLAPRLFGTWLQFKTPVSSLKTDVASTFPLWCWSQLVAAVEYEMVPKNRPSDLNLCLCMYVMTESSLVFLCLCCASCLLCRSRLADYLVNCWVNPHTVSTCPNQDNHQACLASYARLIGQ